MIFYEFGEKTSPVILLLPGTCCHWNMKRESVYNQFYSDLITPLEDRISVSGTTVHCFYAAKMGEEHLRRYQKHFENPVIHPFDMEHEELLVLHPDRWSEKVKEVVL